MTKFVLAVFVSLSLAACRHPRAVRARHAPWPPQAEVEPREFVVVVEMEKPLLTLAWNYLVHEEVLADRNGLTPDAILKPGDRIIIPAMTPEPPSKPLPKPEDWILYTF